MNGTHLRDQVVGELADRVQLNLARLGERLEAGELGDRPVPMTPTAIANPSPL